MKDLFKDLKLQLFKSGLTDEQMESISQQETAEKEFELNQDKVKATMKTAGWEIIISKMVVDMEVLRSRLLTCKPDTLKEIQQEIKVRKDFLDEWSQYIE